MENELKKEEMAGTAENRSGIYGFLSIVYMREPDAEFIKAVKNPDILKGIEGAGLNLSESIRNMDEKILEEELCVEYSSLFIGPKGRVSLYASVWLDEEKRLWGETTVKIKNIIESHGLKYKKSWTDMPDHIGVLFEFMQRLTELESRAWKDGDEKTAMLCVACEKHFINDYMIKWIPAFCDKITERTESTFYKEMAGLTKVFMEFESGRVKGIV